MNIQEKYLEAFQVIGIKVRTSNVEEMSGVRKIPDLWSKFYSQQIAEKIPNKIAQEILAIYYDYESDANAPYSLLIGAKVSKGTMPPIGLEVIDIPAQTYSQFTTSKGMMPNIIIDVWKHIWKLTDESALNRKFSFDFEVYDYRSANPNSAEADLFISIK